MRTIVRAVMLPWFGWVFAAGCQPATPLFNGRDLVGWVEVGSRGAWSVADGVLRCDGRKDGYAWLSTDRRYGDFILELDWRVEREGNSGVFLRAPDREGRTSMKGLEVQIRDDATDDNLSDASGAVFRRIPAGGKFSRPAGEWNHFRITMRGRRLRIELNGYLVSDSDIDAVVPPDKDFVMTGVPPEGYIGLQNHGTPVEFRGIVLRERR